MWFLKIYGPRIDCPRDGLSASRPVNKWIRRDIRLFGLEAPRRRLVVFCGYFNEGNVKEVCSWQNQLSRVITATAGVDDCPPVTE